MWYCYCAGRGEWLGMRLNYARGSDSTVKWPLGGRRGGGGVWESRGKAWFAFIACGIGPFVAWNLDPHLVGSSFHGPQSSPISPFFSVWKLEYRTLSRNGIFLSLVTLFGQFLSNSNHPSIHPTQNYDPKLLSIPIPYFLRSLNLILSLQIF